MIESIRAVARTLNDAGVEYLVVGGVAVVLHGYLRQTQDLDLVLRMTRENILAAVDGLASLGYHPTAPVDPRDLADPIVRSQWITDKGMTVLSLVSPRHPSLVVDLFAVEPFDMEPELKDRIDADLDGIRLPVVSIHGLIRMKEQVGRANDRVDIEHLRRIRDLNHQESGSEGEA